MAYFRKVFPLVVLLSLWVVLLLSLVQIRRSLVPLGRLKEGTGKVATGDFETRVHIASKDEFGELAASFNTMSSRLGSQFRALNAISEIDRAILSARQTEEVVENVLTGIHQVFSCKVVSVTLIEPNSPNQARTCVKDASSKKGIESEVTLAPDEIEQLYNHRHSIILGEEDTITGYLLPLARAGMAAFLVLPVFNEEDLTGIVALGYQDEEGDEGSGTSAASLRINNDLDEARHAADQVAVALANARLMEELEYLNWGTLQALARTVDAKSAWTAGHSERVAKLVWQIGSVMGKNPQEIDTLCRAALLHDIGKIGVDAIILEKRGKLTDEEYQDVKLHPPIGARILEPISTYSDIVPIVLQHHEHFDGTGYPSGLSGKDICIGARILAVADVYDALTSDRPYRRGWEKSQAITYIKEETRLQFDPVVVGAFLKVIKRRQTGERDAAPTLLGATGRFFIEERSA